MNQNNRPNILFITTDQMRYDAVGYDARTEVRTPCLDRIARNGVTFQSAYTTFPVCGPARSSILSGVYGKTHKVNFSVRGRHGLDEGEWTFARALRDVGYRTAAIGKMHFFPMYADHGFEVMRLAEHDPNVPGCFTEDDYHRELAEKGLQDVQEEWQFPTCFPHASEEYRQNLQAVPFQLPEPYHSTSWIRDEAIRFLEEHNREGTNQPYFMWVSFLRPHHPFNPPAPYDTMYPSEDLNVPDPSTGWESLPEHAHSLFSQRMSNGVYDLSGLDDSLIRRITSYYYGSITHIDDCMEALLQHIDLDNTLIVFTSDHGEYLGHRGRLLKDPPLPLDDLARVPMAVMWKGRIAANRTFDAPVSLADLAPTFLDAANIKVPPAVEGHSILQLLEQPETADERPVYCETHGALPTVMVRYKRWKYIWHLKVQSAQLHDIVQDPEELRNLSGDPGLVEVEGYLHRLAIRFLNGGTTQ
ncbi:sulfatase family protein [Paenibacillus spongiae]|uniref:Sulfatase-like hydrolase/transferase n=1 Tax=Paenibacillus spongiae TaxID=2909671 RepID=A0ABY5SLC5_9BACL|nr:sulfatase-like hydrolase/transferase [Paenibacillus spongiae]UVI33378.1 sulfatase-like hydrolase/transferase [Paenibacillus spongiae]